MRPAEKLSPGTATHFQLAAKESKDFALQLSAGSYCAILDLKRTDGRSGNIQAEVRLLKSNGSLVKNSVIWVSDIHVISRSGGKFDVVQPFAARFRVSADQDSEGWLTVIPAAQMHLIPFGYPNSEVQPLTIGAAEAKGGTLDKYGWAFHKIALPAGTYTVSLYLSQLDTEKTNLQGQLDQLDAYGVPVRGWQIGFNEIDVEARKEKTITLTKPATLLFRVSNQERPLKYNLTIEKGAR